jgi:hypothetical protein
MLIAFGIVAFDCQSCKNVPAVPPSTIQSVESAACTLIGILDPAGSGNTIAAVCEDLKPVVSQIIDQLIQDAGAKSRVTSVESMRFVPLKRSGNVVGYARFDVAGEIQARLDSQVGK